MQRIRIHPLDLQIILEHAELDSVGTAFMDGSDEVWTIEGQEYVRDVTVPRQFKEIV